MRILVVALLFLALNAELSVVHATTVVNADAGTKPSSRRGPLHSFRINKSKNSATTAALAAQSTESKNKDATTDSTDTSKPASEAKLKKNTFKEWFRGRMQKLSFFSESAKHVWYMLLLTGFICAGLAVVMGMSEKGVVSGWSEGGITTRTLLVFRYISMAGYLMTIVLTFTPYIVKLFMLNKTQEQLDNNLFYQAILDSRDWAGIIITSLLFFAAVFEFIGYEMECPELTDEHGAPVQGLYSYRLKGPYPPISHALTWTCGADCLLVCARGYRPVNAMVECKNKGGKGQVWSHLSVYSDQGPDPACCFDNEKASGLSNISVVIASNSPGKVAYNVTFRNGPEYVSRGCGEDQMLLLQACDVGSVQGLWQQAAACSMKCDLANPSVTECFAADSTALADISDDEGPQGRALTEVSFNPYGTAFLTSRQYLFRIVHKTSMGEAVGPWKQPSLA